MILILMISHGNTRNNTDYTEWENINKKSKYIFCHGKQVIYLLFNPLFFRVIRVFPWLIIKISIMLSCALFSVA